MLFHKTVDQRNHVIISHGDTSVIFHIFISDLSFIIHDLRDLVKLINGCHDLIIICFFVVSVKRFGWILDQNMIKDMCHLFKRPCRTGCFYVFVFFCSCLHLLIRIIGRSLFQKIDSFVIVILTGQKLCLCESIFGSGLCIFSTCF